MFIFRIAEHACTCWRLWKAPYFKFTRHNSKQHERCLTPWNNSCCHQNKWSFLPAYRIIAWRKWSGLIILQCRVWGSEFISWRCCGEDWSTHRHIFTPLNFRLLNYTSELKTHLPTTFTKQGICQKVILTLSTRLHLLEVCVVYPKKTSNLGILCLDRHQASENKEGETGLHWIYVKILHNFSFQHVFSAVQISKEQFGPHHTTFCLCVSLSFQGVNSNCPSTQSRAVVPCFSLCAKITVSTNPALTADCFILSVNAGVSSLGKKKINISYYEK